MPDIPNLPGVPALTSYSDNLPALIFADALEALSTLLLPSWGIYLDGAPVIAPASVFGQQINTTLGAISDIAAAIGIPNIVPVNASTAEFDYAADSPISTYAQEQGAFQSYDKVQLPFDVKMRLAVSGSPSQRQAFFNTLEALRTSTALVDILTPEQILRSCNCKHVDYRRSARHGVELIVADVWFEQVRVISASTFSNTQSPANAAPVGGGNVQAQPATDAVTQQFNGVGGAPY